MEREMKKTIVLVDHTSRRKFRIIIDPEPSCLDCFPSPDEGGTKNELKQDFQEIPLFLNL
jgi:hypothetical protein